MKYNYPVFATQGGGLVKEIGRSGIYEFIEAPDCPGFGVGDHMPAEWGIAPFNRQARMEEDFEMEFTEMEFPE